MNRTELTKFINNYLKFTTTLSTGDFVYEYTYFKPSLSSTKYADKIRGKVFVKTNEIDVILNAIKEKNPTLITDRKQIIITDLYGNVYHSENKSFLNDTEISIFKIDDVNKNFDYLRGMGREETDNFVIEMDYFDRIVRLGWEDRDLSLMYKTVNLQRRMVIQDLMKLGKTYVMNNIDVFLIQGLDNNKRRKKEEDDDEDGGVCVVI